MTGSNNSTTGEAGIYTDGKGTYSFKWNKTVVKMKGYEGNAKENTLKCC